MRISITLFLTILTVSQLMSQIDAQFSQYWTCKTFYNPGATGAEKGVNVKLNYRNQWVGISGAPKTMLLSVDFPFDKWNKTHGIGIHGVKDEIGLFKNTAVYVDYAYKIKMTNGLLSIGSQLGVINQNFDGSKVSNDNLSPLHLKDDPAIPTSSVQAMALDFGLGVRYSMNNFYIGLSTTHLTNPTIDLDDKSAIYIGRMIYFDTGLIYPIEGSQIVIRPSLLYKTDNRYSVLDMTLRADFSKSIVGGISYRWNSDFVLILGINLKDISVGYSYDISTSHLFKNSSGSHEISLAYNFNIDIENKSKRKVSKNTRYL